jgi:hypothetical protein
MTSGAVLAPQMEQPDPPERRALGCIIAKKPTNSLELGREPLSSGPNEGLCLGLGVLPSP